MEGPSSGLRQGRIDGQRVADPCPQSEADVADRQRQRGEQRRCSAIVPVYRTMKKTGSAVNKAIKQTKAAMSILLPQCLRTGLVDR
jgi:hypothetical protein